MLCVYVCVCVVCACMRVHVRVCACVCVCGHSMLRSAGRDVLLSAIYAKSTTENVG